MFPRQKSECAGFAKAGVGAKASSWRNASSDRLLRLRRRLCRTRSAVAAIRDGLADNTIGLDRTNGMKSVVEKAAIKVELSPDFGD